MSEEVIRGVKMKEGRYTLSPPSKAVTSHAMGVSVVVFQVYVCTYEVDIVSRRKMCIDRVNHGPVGHVYHGNEKERRKRWLRKEERGREREGRRGSEVRDSYS